jgi:WD40 repeat protein
VAFSPNNTMLATACSDAYDPHMYPRRYGRVWDAHTGEPLTPPLQHSDGVLFCTFTPDSKRVITTSEDGTAQIWDVTTGTMLAVPLRHSSHVYGARVTADGSRVLTWGRDGMARMWDVFTGDAVIPPIRVVGQVVRAALSPDGSRVLVGSEAGEVGLWNLLRDDRPVPELASLATLLTGQRLDPLSGPTALDSQELKQMWNTFRRKYPQAFRADPARILSSQ